jgi:hypothetical protein
MASSQAPQSLDRHGRRHSQPRTTKAASRKVKHAQKDSNVTPQLEAGKDLRQEGAVGAAESDAFSDDGLRFVIEAWPDLPEVTRRRVLGLVRKAVRRE